MSYLRIPRRQRRTAVARRGRGPLGLGDDVNNPDLQTFCADPTNYSQAGLYCSAYWPDGPPLPPSITVQTGSSTLTTTDPCIAAGATAGAPIDAQSADLKANWNPTGFYTPTQIRQLISQMTSLMNVAQAGLAGVSAPSQADVIKQSQDDINAVLAQAANYTAAAQQADASHITAVNAPGLKGWVLKAMDTASETTYATAVINCVASSTAMNLIIAGASTLYDIAKTIAGIVLQVGQLALHTIENSLGLLAWLTANATTVALVGAGGIALWLITRDKTKALPFGL